MLTSTFHRLEFVSQLKCDAPGLGIQIRNIEGPVVERAFLAKEIQRQLSGEIPADSKARISLVEEREWVASIFAAVNGWTRPVL